MMTVKELKDALEEYGDHLQVRIVVDEEMGLLEGIDAISTEENRELGTYVVLHTAEDDEDETEVDDEEDDEDEVKDDE